MSDEPEKSAYSQGYEAALIPPPKQPECPFAEGTKERDDWQDGYGDATEDMLANATC